MKWITRAFFFLLLVGLSPVLVAAPSDAVVEQQSEQLLREQQQQLKLLERERNLRELERSLRVLEPPTPEPAPERAVPPVCFEITRIELRGADNLYAFEKQSLIEPYLNRCLTVEDIDRLRVDIDRFYIEKGWILSRAYLLPEQNLKEGVLIFQVLEGRLDGIQLNEGRLHDRLQVLTAFPGMVDEVAYIRDIEQGLEQINRLTSNRATMDIVPVPEKPGYGQLQISNQPEDRFRYHLGYDNLGSESTGQDQGKLVADVDNLLWLNDQWMITASQYVGGDDEEKDSESISANLSIPYGYWTLNLNHSYSRYLTTISDNVGDFRLSGDSTTSRLKASRVVHRDRHSKTSFGMDLAHKANDSFLEDVRLDTSSRRLTIFTIDAQHVRRVPSGIWSFGAAYARGLDLFDALQDGPVRDDDVPRAQFEKLSLDVSTIQTLGVLGEGWSYRGLLSGQLSRDPLFGSEQITLGDSGTVRGFRNSPLAGDSGAYLRNDLIWDLPGDSVLTRGMSLSLGLDGGYLVAINDNLANSGEPDAWLAGVALGVQQSVSLPWRQVLTWSATYGHPLHHPDIVEADDHIFYASVDWKWW